MLPEENSVCMDTSASILSCVINSECKETDSESISRENNTLEDYNTTEAYAMPAKVEGRNQKEAPQFPNPVTCLCQTHRISTYTLPVKAAKGNSKPLWCRFKWKWPRKGYFERNDKTYEVKLKQKQCPHYTKPFVCCEISEGIPSKKHEPRRPKPPKYQEKQKEKEKEVAERVDIYYFDHGNSAYYRTTDSPPILLSERCAERTDQAATRFWAEIFGTIHIGVAFVTAFVLQLLRFLLFSIVRPLTVGVLQLLADYFIKPLLSIIFNALIQPVLILLYNIATSMKDFCEPIAGTMGLFLREIANVCATIRIVEVKQECKTTACT